MNIPSFDYKSNYLNMLTHKPTTLIPGVMLGNKILGFGPIPGPAIEKGDHSVKTNMSIGLIRSSAALCLSRGNMLLDGYEA